MKPSRFLNQLEVEVGTDRRGTRLAGQGAMTSMKASQECSGLR